MNDVTLDELREYKALKESIGAIEAEIESLYYPVSSPPLTSSGGHSSQPGDPTVRAFHQIEQDRERLTRKHAELSRQKARIDEWLDSLDDQHIGAIIRYRFIIGLSWRMTCSRIYGYPDADICRMEVRRYFGKR